MKIEYLHKLGGMVHQGPSGTVYEFAPDESGRRVAEVNDPTDQARLLSLTDLRGCRLFVSLSEPEANEANKLEPEQDQTSETEAAVTDPASAPEKPRARKSR